MVRYEEVNQWRIYNPKIKKIYISITVWFNKIFNYYDNSHEATNKNNESVELSDIQNKIDNDKFDKIIVGKPEKPVLFDSKEEKDTDNLLESVVGNNYLGFY